MKTLYTAGYSAGWTPEILLAKALELGAYVYDIRLNPTSIRPEWRKEALAQVIGDYYRHRPELGNLNYRGGPIELADPLNGVEWVNRCLRKCPVILLCGCSNWQLCHRQTAAELCAKELGCTVEHLEAPLELTDGAMPVLTLTPPWSELVRLRKKRIETRNWATAYRGPLAIHAAATLGPVDGKRGLREICGRQPFFDALYPIVPNHDIYCDVDAIMSTLTYGAIVAACDLIDCVQTQNPGVMNEPGMPWIQITRGEQLWEVPPPEPELSFGDYSPGRFAWILDNIRPLATPVPARGYQRLIGKWTPPSEVVYG